jgi:beta-galactosidase
MRALRSVPFAAILYTIAAASAGMGQDPAAVPLPQGVKAVWDMDKAYHQTTPTRERICIDGLWRWQPAEIPHPSPLPKGEGTGKPSLLPKDEGTLAMVPTGNWGYFKVPGCWPGITDYMQKDTQTIYPHPTWRGQRLGSVAAAWYEREISVPKEWAGRRVALCIEYLN